MSIDTLTTHPLPITLDEVKAYLRIDGTDEDATLTDLLAAAAEHVQNETGQQVIPAKLRLTLDRFPSTREIKLRPPLRSVSSVEYIDPQGVERTICDTLYSVDTTSQPGRLVFSSALNWPATIDRAAAVTITFEAGPTPTPMIVVPPGRFAIRPQPIRKLPDSLRQAILFLVGHWFEHREAVTDRRFDDVPLTYKAVIVRHTFYDLF